MRRVGSRWRQVVSTPIPPQSQDGNQSFSIAIVDDHKLFLNGLVLMIENAPGAHEVAAFECPLELIDTLDNGHRFDLIICDLIMNRMNGLAFVDSIRRNHQVPVLMLSGINTAPPIPEMRKLGVVGFVHKAAEDAILFEAIESALAGRTFFPTDYANADDDAGEDEFGRQVELAGDTGSIPTLSARQMEVLKLLAGGATNGEIASRLGISENTVKTHLRAIFDSLRVTKRTACVRTARSLGVI